MGSMAVDRRRLFLAILSCCCLVIPNALHANRVRDLPSSRNGQFEHFGVIPPVCFDPFTWAYISNPVTGPITFTHNDPDGPNFKVEVTPYNFTSWACPNGQPQLAAGVAHHYTLLEIVLTEMDSGAAPILNSLWVGAGLTNPGFIYFGSPFMTLGTSSPYEFDDSHQIISVAQPSPVSGADGSNTVWSFGLVVDPNGGPSFGIQGLDTNERELSPSCPAPANACGLAAVLNADGFVNENGLPLSTNGYAITARDAHDNLISLGATPPSGISAAGKDVVGNPIVVTNQTTPTIYDVSGNYPLQDATGAQIFRDGLQASDFPPPGTCAAPRSLAFHSVWFKFDPPPDTQETFTTLGSRYDTVLAVYEGPDVDHLTYMGCDDDLDNPQRVQSTLTLPTGDHPSTYYILVTEYPPIAGTIAVSDENGGIVYPPDSGLTGVSPLSGDSTLYFQVTDQLLRAAPASTAANATAALAPPALALSAATSSSGKGTANPRSVLQPYHPRTPNGTCYQGSRPRPRRVSGLGTSSVTVGCDPNSIVVNDATNKIYLTNLDEDGPNNGVYVIDISDDGTFNPQQIYTSGGAAAVAVNPVRNEIYAANVLDNTVTIIDGRDNSTSTVSVGAFPAALAVNSMTNRVYVANQADNTVTVIDRTAHAVATVAVGVYPDALAVNSVTNQVYVVNKCGAGDPNCSGSGTVALIDGENNVIASVNIGRGAGAIAVNSVTNQIYVSNQADNTVTAIDGPTLRTTTIAVGHSPYAIGINPITNKIYVANVNDSTVTMIDGFTNTASPAVAVGSTPYALAVDSALNQIYVANSQDNSVWAIDGATSLTAPLFDTDSFPVALAINATNNTIYVANEGVDNVTVSPGGDQFGLTVTVSGGGTVTSTDGLINCPGTVTRRTLPAVRSRWTPSRRRTSSSSAGVAPAAVPARAMSRCRRTNRSPLHSRRSLTFSPCPPTVTAP